MSHIYLDTPIHLSPLQAYTLEFHMTYTHLFQGNQHNPSPDPLFTFSQIKNDTPLKILPHNHIKGPILRIIYKAN